MTDDTSPSDLEPDIADGSGDQLGGEGSGDVASPTGHDGSESSGVDGAEDPTGRSGHAHGRRWVAIGLAGVVVVLFAMSQIHLVRTLDDTRSELEATRSEVAAVEERIDELTSSVREVADDVEGMGVTTTPITPAADTATPEGHLPRFVQGQQDSALGLMLGTVTGPDAYTGTAATIDPADGTKRLWIVWAHWCPYCQRELPELSAMYADLRATYPTIDIATVTTSIDPSQGNPLDAYLEAQQFPFPVIVDTDLALASQLGASAFPFWVVTDGDGTVLLRAAGYLEEARVRSLAATLDEYGA